MIKINYSGTADIDVTNPENEEQLYREIEEEIRSRLNDHELMFSPLSIMTNDCLKPGKIIFNVTIDLLPPESIKIPYAKTIN